MCAMTLDFVLPLAAYAVVSSITPGPNNLMLLASGANFGVRRTVPHLAGIWAGVFLMFLIVGAGLARVFEAWPVTRTVLMVLSVAYLLYLAFKIATAAPPKTNGEGAAEGRPLTFFQALMFQWVNPKAWAMGLTVMSVYVPGPGFGAVLAAAAVFLVSNLPCTTSWAVAGKQLRRFLTDRRRLRVFNAVMAVLLVASLIPVLI